MPLINCLTMHIWSVIDWHVYISIRKVLYSLGVIVSMHLPIQYDIKMWVLKSMAVAFCLTIHSLCVVKL